MAGIISVWLFFAFFCLVGFFFPFEFRLHKPDRDISPHVVRHMNVAVELQAGVWQWANARLSCVQVRVSAFICISRNFAGLDFVLADVCTSLKSLIRTSLHF